MATASSRLPASANQAASAAAKGKRNWRECVAVSDKKGAVRKEQGINRPVIGAFEKKPVWQHGSGSGGKGTGERLA